MKSLNCLRVWVAALAVFCLPAIHAATVTVDSANVLVDTRDPLSLTVTASSHGAVSGAGQYAPGSAVILTPTPSAGYVFTGWTGAATGTQNPLTVTLASNQEIGATFAPDTGDSDGDGLTNFEELTIYATNPNLADSDGDGLSDGYEAGIGRFSIVAVSSTWAQARADARTRGGELACFPTQVVWNQAIASLGATALDDYTGLWVGASDAAVEGTWKWVNGTAFSYSAWALNRPSAVAGNTLDYAEVSGGAGADIGKWYDRSPTTVRDGYILEIGYTTDPRVADTDGDGLSDGAEVLTHHTNPRVADTDGDGYSDGYEVANASDPTLASSFPTYTLALSGSGVATGGSFSKSGTLAHGSTATLTAVAEAGYVISAWTGDLAGSDNPQTLLMDGDKTVGAEFGHDTQDSDGDGLTNYEESVTYGTNPNRADTDGDGLTDIAEIQTQHTNPVLKDSNGDGLADGVAVQMGLDPLADHAALVQIIHDSRETFGLYTQQDMTDLRPGSTTVKVLPSAGGVQLRLKVQQSADLQNWQDAGEAVYEQAADPAAPKRFFRFGVE